MWTSLFVCTVVFFVSLWLARNGARSDDKDTRNIAGCIVFFFTFPAFLGMVTFAMWKAIVWIQTLPLE